jgi:hypothetical protein
MKKTRQNSLSLDAEGVARGDASKVTWVRWFSRSVVGDNSGLSKEGGSNDLADTSAGLFRTAIGDNCCCYYWDCCTRCCLESHTEPCPQEDLDSGCRTEAGRCCQRQQVGTRWEGAERVEGAVQGHQQPDASDHRLEVLRGVHPREHAVVDRTGGAHRQPCAAPLPPSS